MQEVTDDEVDDSIPVNLFRPAHVRRAAPDPESLNRVLAMLLTAALNFLQATDAGAPYPEEAEFQVPAEELAVVLLLVGKAQVRSTLQYILESEMDEFSELLLEKLPHVEACLEKLVVSVAPDD